uniref:GST N-terminal domain-containing protein n=1 Tax=Calcidiscus leptoporus TaxID=127549 RepID=A0A7S0IZC8_9EUKA
MRTITMLFLLLAKGADAVALTVRYFDARGAAEITRVLLALSGQQYTDHRYKIEAKEGGGFSTPEFSADKESGALAANLNRAPLLEVDGTPIGQSKAIERYVAAQGGLMGATPLEAALIDSVAEHVRDVKDAQARKGFGMFSRDKSDEEKTRLRDEWYATELPSWLQRIEGCVAPLKRVVCGETPSYAAVCIWALLREGKDEDVALVAKAAEGCGTLNEIAEAVAAHPAVKSWVASRPVTMM